MVVKKPRIVIIGAGMAGLTAAHRLHNAAPDLLHLTVLEAGPRIGGRIFTSTFAGDRVEMGATWIHGIEGSPLFSLASDIDALTSTVPYERMNTDFPLDHPLTLALSDSAGSISRSILPSLLVDSVSSLYRRLMDAVRDGTVAVPPAGPGVGSYLKKGLEQHRSDLILSHRRDGEGQVDWAVDAVFAMNENTERTFTSADDLDDLDLAAESEYREFPGEQITIAGGYSALPEALASALPEGSVRLNARAGRIEWSTEDGHVRVHLEGGGVIAADHVIVTVSLGVLKAGLRKEADHPAALEFSPPLPAFKREAIGRLGFGVVNKLFLEMEGGGAPLPFVQLAFDDVGTGSGDVSRVPRWMRKTASFCPIYGGSRVMLAWLAGEEAREMEGVEEDEEIAGGVHATLEEGLGSLRVRRVKRSGWGKNPLFRGSYSYVAVGSSGDDLDLMAEPLPRGGSGEAPQLLFAGEATHRTHYSTTHGAYFSGIREANRILHYYRILSS